MARVTAGAAPDPEALSAFADIVGSAHVLTENETTAGYCIDWTGRFSGQSPAVVRPRTTQEVSELLRVCVEHGVHVVPQGGNTGLVGGSVPLHGEVVMSLQRMTTIDAVDPLSHQVTVEAGATLADLQTTAAQAGLAFGVDLAARDSCTIGGMVATNAGGIHVLRHGSMRQQIVGLETVLSDGRVLRHLAGLHKDNTGYDLDRLMCGSEGTLGVITRVRVQLVPALGHIATAMIGLDDVAEAVGLLAHLRQTVPSLLAAEAIMASAMDVVRHCQGLEPPVPARALWLLVEAASSTTDPVDELAEGLMSWREDLDVAVATDGPGSERLWRFRETITESISQLGVPHKLDVTLPAATLAAFNTAVGDLIAERAPDARTVVFGHLGDGNLHVNVLGAVDDDDIDGAVLKLVADHGGSISAEHGIGTAKSAWLHLSRTTAELATFRALRAALDPAGILNPHVLAP